MQRNKSLSLVLSWWVEIVISLRVVLFTLPILLNKAINKALSALSIEDWFVLILTFTGLLHFMVGIASLLRHRLWKAYHVVVTLLVLVLTLGLIRQVIVLKQPWYWFYFLPFMGSAFFLIVNFVFDKKITGVDKTVLVVDDDQTLIRTVQSILAKEGFTVLKAVTGEEGLSAAQRHKPDVVLLDVILPSMKGRDVCKALKNDAQTKDIPVIFLTAKDSKDDIEAEMAAGAVAHLTKPVEPNRLIKAVRRAIKF